MDIQHEIGRAKNAVSAGDYSTAQKIRINGEMTLKKENGVWKIYNQKVHNVKYLN